MSPMSVNLRTHIDGPTTPEHSGTWYLHSIVGKAIFVITYCIYAINSMSSG
jgi:hypothetical protein